jgi:hypothetical protein
MSTTDNSASSNDSQPGSSPLKQTEANQTRGTPQYRVVISLLASLYLGCSELCPRGVGMGLPLAAAHRYVVKGQDITVTARFQNWFDRCSIHRQVSEMFDPGACLFALNTTDSNDRKFIEKYSHKENPGCLAAPQLNSVLWIAPRCQFLKIESSLLEVSCSVGLVGVAPIEIPNQIYLTPVNQATTQYKRCYDELSESSVYLELVQGNP